jgi:hypothetical protein
VSAPIPIKQDRRTPWRFIACGYRCFRNYRKWRKAVALGRAAAILYREGNDLFWPLHEMQAKLYAEIHQQPPTP